MAERAYLTFHVRRLRRRRGWSQTNLARRLGVTQPVVSAFERRARQTDLQVTDLARVLEVDESEITRRPSMQELLGIVPAVVAHSARTAAAMN
jgi:transcriptional regulator with XRE-family HTH domain